MDWNGHKFGISEKSNAENSKIYKSNFSRNTWICDHLRNRAKQMNMWDQMLCRQSNFKILNNKE